MLDAISAVLGLDISQFLDGLATAQAQVQQFVSQTQAATAGLSLGVTGTDLSASTASLNGYAAAQATVTQNGVAMATAQATVATAVANTNGAVADQSAMLSDLAAGFAQVGASAAPALETVLSSAVAAGTGITGLGAAVEELTAAGTAYAGSTPGATAAAAAFAAAAAQGATAATDLGKATTDTAAALAAWSGAADGATANMVGFDAAATTTTGTLAGLTASIAAAAEANTVLTATAGSSAEATAASVAADEALISAHALLAEAEIAVGQGAELAAAANAVLATSLEGENAEILLATANLEAQAAANRAAADAAGQNETAQIGLSSRGMGLIPIAAAAVSFAALKMGTDLDAAMSKIQGFAGAPAASIDELRGKILALEAQTGVSATKIAEGLYLAASAGLSVADAWTVTERSTRLAQAGFTDAKTVVDVTTSALNAYHLQASQTSQIQDVLTATVVSGKMEFADLASNVGKILPLAAASGVSLAEVGASIAEMTEKGIGAGQATAALSGILSALEAPTATTRKELASLGLSADDVRAAIRDRGLLQTLSDLDQRTGGNIDQLKDLVPRIQGLRGILADLGQSGSDYTRVLDANNAAYGRSQQAIDTYATTSQAALNQLTGTAKAGLTELGLSMGQLVIQVDDLVKAVELAGPQLKAVFVDGIGQYLAPLRQFGDEIDKLIGRVSGSKPQFTLKDALGQASEIKPLTDGLNEISGLLDKLTGKHQTHAQAVQIGQVALQGFDSEIGKAIGLVGQLTTTQQAANDVNAETVAGLGASVSAYQQHDAAMKDLDGLVKMAQGSQMGLAAANQEVENSFGALALSADDQTKRTAALTAATKDTDKATADAAKSQLAADEAVKTLGIAYVEASVNGNDFNKTLDDQIAKAQLAAKETDALAKNMGVVVSPGTGQQAAQASLAPIAKDAYSSTVEATAVMDRYQQAVIAASLSEQDFIEWKAKETELTKSGNPGIAEGAKQTIALAEAIQTLGATQVENTVFGQNQLSVQQQNTALMLQQQTGVQTLTSLYQASNNSLQQHATFQRELADALLHVNDSADQYKAHIQELTLLTQSADPATKAYADAELKLVEATHGLTDAQIQQALHQVDVNDALSGAKNNVNDSLPVYQALIDKLNDVTVTAQQAGDALLNSLSKPTPAELDLKAQLAGVKDQADQLNATFANSSPADQAIVTAQKKVNADQLSGATVKQLTKDEADLQAQLSAGNALYPQQDIALANNVTALDAKQKGIQGNLTAEQSHRESLSATTAAAQAHATGMGVSMPQAEAAVTTYTTNAGNKLYGLASTATTAGTQTGANNTASFTSAVVAGTPAAEAVGMSLGTGTAQAATQPAAFASAAKTNVDSYAQTFLAELQAVKPQLGSAVASMAGAVGGPGTVVPGTAAGGATSAGSFSGGGLPPEWYAAIQAHESTLPLPSAGSPQPMFGFIPGAPGSVGTHSYTSGGTAAASATLGEPAGMTNQALFPSVQAGMGALDALWQQWPDAVAAVQTKNFTAFLQSLVSHGYAGPGEGPGFISQIAGTLGNGNVAAFAGAGGATPAAAAGSGFMLPAQGYPITANFGATEGSGTERGVDFGTPQGTPLVAGASGTVSSIQDRGQASGLGTWVTIDFPDGTKEILGHLSQVLVQTGQQVTQGQEVGLSGGATASPNASISTGPHVEVQYINAAGQNVNPLASAGASDLSGLGPLPVPAPDTSSQTTATQMQTGATNDLNQATQALFKTQDDLYKLGQDTSHDTIAGLQAQLPALQADDDKYRELAITAANAALPAIQHWQEVASTIDMSTGQSYKYSQQDVALAKAQAQTAIGAQNDAMTSFDQANKQKTQAQQALDQMLQQSAQAQKQYSTDNSGFARQNETDTRSLIKGYTDFGAQVDKLSAEMGNAFDAAGAQQIVASEQANAKELGIVEQKRVAVVSIEQQLTGDMSEEERKRLTDKLDASKGELSDAQNTYQGMLQQTQAETQDFLAMENAKETALKDEQNLAKTVAEDRDKLITASYEASLQVTRSIESNWVSAANAIRSAQQDAASAAEAIHKLQTPTAPGVPGVPGSSGVPGTARAGLEDPRLAQSPYAARLLADYQEEIRLDGLLEVAQQQLMEAKNKQVQAQAEYTLGVQKAQMTASEAQAQAQINMDSIVAKHAIDTYNLQMKADATSQGTIISNHGTASTSIAQQDSTQAAKTITAAADVLTAVVTADQAAVTASDSMTGSLIDNVNKWLTSAITAANKVAQAYKTASPPSGTGTSGGAGTTGGDIPPVKTAADVLATLGPNASAGAWQPYIDETIQASQVAHDAAEKAAGSVASVGTAAVGAAGQVVAASGASDTALGSIAATAATASGAIQSVFAVTTSGLLAPLAAANNAMDAAQHNVDTLTNSMADLRAVIGQVNADQQDWLTLQPPIAQVAQSTNQAAQAVNNFGTAATTAAAPVKNLGTAATSTAQATLTMAQQFQNFQVSMGGVGESITTASSQFDSFVSQASTGEVQLAAQSADLAVKIAQVGVSIANMQQQMGVAPSFNATQHELDLLSQIAALKDQEGVAPSFAPSQQELDLMNQEAQIQEQIAGINAQVVAAQNAGQFSQSFMLTSNLTGLQHQHDALQAQIDALNAQTAAQQAQTAVTTNGITQQIAGLQRQADQLKLNRDASQAAYTAQSNAATQALADLQKQQDALKLQATSLTAQDTLYKAQRDDLKANADAQDNLTKVTTLGISQMEAAYKEFVAYVKANPITIGASAGGGVYPSGQGAAGAGSGPGTSVGSDSVNNFGAASGAGGYTAPGSPAPGVGPAVYLSGGGKYSEYASLDYTPAVSGPSKGVPSFDLGGYVQQSGLAYVHAGETVIAPNFAPTANQGGSPAGLGGPINVTIDMRNGQWTGSPQQNEAMVKRVVQDAFTQAFGRGAVLSGLRGG